MDWINLLAFFPFCLADWALAKANVASPYYLLHAIHNAAIVALTWSDVVNTLTDVHNLTQYTLNTNAVALVLSLHAYHIVRYYKTMKYDDWLHHFLMIGIATPIGIAMPITPLMGYSIFFSTGLPGAISYFALFLQRNGRIERMTEKTINTALNVWVRSPGCISHATLTVAWILSSYSNFETLVLCYAFIPPVLLYWNGQYFMQQAVRDLAQREYAEIAHLSN
jgi:hypothetical protein